LKELYTYNLTQQVTHPHHRVILSDWATLLLCLLFIQFTFNIVPLFTPDTQFPRWCVMVFLLLVIEVLVLLYSSMPKGKSLFRYVHIYRQNATYNSDKDESITTPPTFKVPLTKAYFEEIFIQEKLYLNPQLTTGDLLKRFQIDQPTFSAFIRSTYSMRFSKLLNKLRMEEIERLMAGGKFNEQDIEELIRKAGFSSKRSYYRYRQESMTEVPTSPANKKKTQITLSSHSTERIEQFREKFEAYIHNQKPYLNPELKASDLLVAMGTNRQYFSVFINQVYGMNFSAYINSLRQQEMDTLRQEKSKQGLSEMELALHAGFPSYRTYLQYIRNNKGHT
jgi:AraC-like DNA-binding protein